MGQLKEMLKAAKAVKQEFICPECKENGVKTPFPNARQLGFHRYRRHGVAGKTSLNKAARNASGINCPICQVSCISERGLITHMSRAHRDVNREDYFDKPQQQQPQVTQVPSEPTTIELNGIKSCPHCGCDLEPYNVLHAALEQGNIDPKVLQYALQRCQGIKRR